MNKTTQRYSLNANQIHVLKLMFKFRFVTSSLLARYKGISRISINKTLKILLDQQYIGAHYDKSYKIQGKGASYYLAPKALHLLKHTHKLNEQVLHAMYKNKSVSRGFIDHNLDVFSAYLKIRASYPERFHIFTKYELADHDYFISPAPDLYLSGTDTAENQYHDYLLDIFTDTQLFIIKKRIAAYIEHYESGEWEAEADTPYPVILIVCPDSRMEERLQTHIAKILDNTGIDDLVFYTTTSKALASSNEAIWSNAIEPDATLTLP